MRTLHAVILAVGIGAAGMLGCESGRALSVEERAANSPMLADEFGVLGYRVEWRGFPTILPGSRVVRLDPLGDAVGVLDSTGVFTLLDARGGSMRWSDQPADPLTKFMFCSPAEGGAALILASDRKMRELGLDQ